MFSFPNALRRREPQAFTEGEQARLLGQSTSTNPYALCTDNEVLKYGAWLAGWNASNERLDKGTRP